MAYVIGGVSYFVDSGKYLYNPQTNLYLRRLGDTVTEDVLAGPSISYFEWDTETIETVQNQIDTYLKEKSGTMAIQTPVPELVSTISGTAVPPPQPEEEDVPVTRSAALIEEALNAKAAEAGTPTPDQPAAPEPVPEPEPTPAAPEPVPEPEPTPVAPEPEAEEISN